MTDQEFWQAVDAAATVDQQLDVFLELIDQVEEDTE
jgi:hypothetical protein